jgi:hypothetical protein
MNTPQAVLSADGFRWHCPAMFPALRAALVDSTRSGEPLTSHAPRSLSFEAVDFKYKETFAPFIAPEHLN